MKNSVHIKSGTLEQASKVYEHVPEFHENPAEPFYTVAQMEERIREKVHVVLLSESLNEPTGAVIGYMDGDAAYCWLAGVDKVCRRDGALKALMEKFEHWARTQKAKAITIKTRNSRRAMLSFLMKNDFLITGVRENPQGALHNGIFLEKPLTQD